MLNNFFPIKNWFQFQRKFAMGEFIFSLCWISVDAAKVVGNLKVYLMMGFCDKVEYLMVEVQRDVKCVNFECQWRFFDGFGAVCGVFWFKIYLQSCLPLFPWPTLLIINLFKILIHKFRLKIIKNGQKSDQNTKEINWRLLETEMVKTL